MSRIIDADKLSADMYHEAFEKDNDMQKWDSGCWIRYKMFENVLKAQPTVEAPDINVGSIDTTTHDSNVVKKGGNDEDRTSGDCISRQAAKDIFTELYGISAIGSVFDKYEWADICETTANELPSIQQEIIRCKDCAYCDSDVVDAPYGMTKKVWWCDRLYAGANENLIVEPDDFCSFAERREDG